MINRPTYCTREQVKRALDVAEVARNNGQVDRAIEAGADSIDGGVDRIGGLMRRRFYPEQRTLTFDWPKPYVRPWRIWLDQYELISVTTLTAGGTTIAGGDIKLYPTGGPPYSRLEVSLGSSATLQAGDTHQQAISLAGLYGYNDNQAAAGALAEALDASETAVDVTDSSRIGVGDLITVDDERMLVTDKTMLDTGQNLGGSGLTAQANSVTVAVTDGTAYAVDEILLIDSERMLIVDIVGNNLTVKRSWDGTVLAAHSAGADIFAPRTLTVERGAVGTTAATHADTTAVTRHVPPALIRDLNVAEALVELLGETSGYARRGNVRDNSRNTISASNIRGQRAEIGLGVHDIRDRCWDAYARKIRKAAI